MSTLTPSSPGRSVMRNFATTLQCFDVLVSLRVKVWPFADKTELPAKGQKSTVVMKEWWLPQQLPRYRIMGCDSEVWQGLCGSLEL